jgi:disulfide bond formation protein DsbB
MKTRNIYLITFILCALLLAGAYYLQYVQGVKPCALCSLQRIIYYVIAILSLLAVAINPQRIWHRIMSAVLSLSALVGLLIASRQVWLQFFPPSDVGCGPNLNFMLQNFPLSETIKTLFYGSGDCALVTWRFLNLSVADWSLVFFAGFLALSLYLLFKKQR